VYRLPLAVWSVRTALRVRQSSAAPLFLHVWEQPKLFLVAVDVPLPAAHDLPESPTIG